MAATMASEGVVDGGTRPATKGLDAVLGEVVI